MVQGVGQTVNLIILNCKGAGMAYMFYSLDLTTDDYLRWANLGIFIPMICVTRMVLLYGTGFLTSRCRGGTSGGGTTNCSNPCTYFRLRWGGAHAERAAAQLEYLLADPDDVMAILKDDGNV